MRKTILSLALGVCLGVTAVAQVPFTQNFEGTNPPAGWTTSTSYTAEAWVYGTTTTISDQYFAPPAHTTFVGINDDKAGSTAPGVDAFLTTPIINNIPSGAFLSFDYYFLGAATSATGATLPAELLNVNISTDGGSTWSVLTSPNGITSNAWVTSFVSLSAYSGQNITLNFEYNDGTDWMYGAAIDNVSIAVPPTNSIQFNTIIPAAGAPASYTLAGGNITLGGSVVNLGGNPITTYTVNYTDGTTSWNDVVTDNIASFDTGHFTSATPYNVTLGNHPVKSWVTLTGDATHTDDTLHTTLVGASFLPVHQPVIEEAGGCWCGWCPRGLVFMDSIAGAAAQDPTMNVSLISVHDKTNGTDPMAVTVYDNGMVALPGFTGFPAITVDRKEILDPSQAFDGYAAHAPDFGFADLTLTTSTSGTALSASATVKPAVDLNGTYQLALVLTETAVTSTLSTYQQHDYYSGGSYGILRDGTTHIDYDLTFTNSFVPPTTEVYNHVARSISGGFNGVASSLPTAMTAGTTYTYNFANTTLASAWHPANMSAVLLLIDVTQGIILNSKSTAMGLAGIAQNNANIVAVNLFPNPANNSFNMNVNLTTGEKTDISLYNVMGQVVSAKSYDFGAGENNINISTDQLASGTYMVLVSSSKGIYQTKVIVIK